MKIHVYEITDTIVSGSTDFGNINIKWEGEKPDIGKDYEVELDIDGFLIWGEDITLSHTESNSIVCDGDSILLYGVLESVDADGYSILRIGSNVIPFLGQGNSMDIGTKIKIRIDSISASPVFY